MVYSTSMISQRFLPSWAHADMHNAHQMILSLEHDHELNTKERSYEVVLTSFDYTPLCYENPTEQLLTHKSAV